MSFKYSSDFKQKAQELKKMIDNVPIVAANTAENFFKERIRQGAWIDTQRERYPDRKKNGRYDKNGGRAILVKSGALLNSIQKIPSNKLKVVIATDRPYAKSHNQGIIGKVQKVRPHTRRNRRGKSYEVKQFTRTMYLPRRQFMGNSDFLNKKIVKEVKRYMRGY